MAVVDSKFREWIAEFKKANPSVADARAIIDTAQYAFAAGRTAQREHDAALRAAPEGFVLVPVEPTREMMDAGRTAVMAAKLASQKWTPRQHYEASGKSTAGIPEDVLDERGPLTKESVAVMVLGAMLAARPQGVKDV